jgi:hypothetical protein
MPDHQPVAAAFPAEPGSIESAQLTGFGFVRVIADCNARWPFCISLTQTRPKPDPAGQKWHDLVAVPARSATWMTRHATARPGS